MKSATAPLVKGYAFGAFRFEEEDQRLIRHDGTDIPLTPRVFATLRYFLENSGRVLEKEVLMQAIWPDCVVEENNLTQNISTLRRAFGDNPAAPRYIATVTGRGYRFLAEVRPYQEQEENEQVSADPPEVDTGIGHSQPFHPGRSRPWPAAALVALVLLFAAAFVFRREQVPPAANAPHFPIVERSIAVLPFKNLSGDPANTYFADGMKDEVLARLSKIHALKVISRTSTERFRNAPPSVREIAQQLGVAYLLEGSVQKSGETVRVTVQLINAQSDAHLWAETFDRRLTDMFSVESEVACRIVASLETTLSRSEKSGLTARPTRNAEAHEAYLKGRYFWNKRTAEGYQQAIEHLTRAVALDARYAQAHAALADALLFLGGDNNQHEMVAQGRATLQKALEMDETLADAHASLGLLAMNFDWDWETAEREFRRAIELDPNCASAHQWYGEFLADMGRFEEGIAEIQRAREFDPLSLIINTDVAKVYFIARRYPEAVAQFQRALQMDPGFDVARGLLALTYSKQGAHERALREIRAIGNIEAKPLYLSWLGYIQGTAGNTIEAENIAQRLLETSRQKYVSPMLLTYVYAGMSDNDRTFSSIEHAFAERAAWAAVALKASPTFDHLRSDPRFADLLRRANLTP